MKIFKRGYRVWLVGLLVVVVTGGMLTQCVITVRQRIHEASLAPVSLGAAHHLGEKFNIPEFYVDRNISLSVGREGGSGTTCCMLLPRVWRPGLSVEVRWELDDWSNESPDELLPGKSDSLGSGGLFIAQVPVERYEHAEQVWVHFFKGNKVRVVSSSIGSEGTHHPIRDSDPHAGDSATVGRPIHAMFSPAELLEMDRIDKERVKKFGDWR